MFIFSNKTRADGQTVRQSPHLYEDGHYYCYPRSENRKSFSKKFSNLKSIADFIRNNPDWGIRMSADGRSPGIIYRDIQIVGY